jgi:2-oxoglutarate ferredoxin oxidoreductase subunit beta
MSSTKDSLSTKGKATWCPGCPNFMILESIKQTLAKLIDEKNFRKEDFCMVADIGCNSKTFDYLNISGIYGLHGRALPTATGIHLGNPKLKVIVFQGDGATYSEGLEHFVHAFRYNFPITLLVYDNQSFSLTTGQPTPTTQKDYHSKANPSGEKFNPLNPIAIALASGATFVARVNAKDLVHTSEILEKALNHKGFSFIEILQECPTFNPCKEIYEKIYKIPDNSDKLLAQKLANEWDYNRREEKIPCGVIYREE